MNKNELELEKLRLRSKNYGDTLNFLKAIGQYGTIVGCMYVMFWGLTEMSTANPEGISAMAEVVKNLNISSIMSYIVAAGCAGGWAFERRAKKRLLKPYAAQRQARESADPYHESSGLTDSGDTPDHGEEN